MEVVQKNMEAISGEVEQMRRIKLFHNEECKLILKKRRQYEYKINGFTKNLDDFLHYIEYEGELLKTVQFRRNSLRVGEKMNAIEHSIMNRIKELYERIIERFPHDSNQFLAYFKFCKKANYVTAASIAVSNMIKVHSDNTEIWQVAAKWHAYDRNDISTALKILCKGLAIHKESKLLYTEAIQLEIRNAVDETWPENSSENTATKKKLCLEKVETYFKEITNHIDDCEYYVKLLEILEEHTFTEAIQKKIVIYLVEKYSSQALTWNILAQRDKKGLPNYPDFDSKASATTKAKLTQCIERYKDGLTKLVDGEKRELWSLYINCLIVARQDEPGVANVLKSNSLKEAFEKANEEHLLSEEYYIQWLELADDCDKPKIMEKAVNRFPQSVELWKLSFKTAMLHSGKETVKKVFNEGIKALKEKSLSLWMGYIRYHFFASDNIAVETIYKESIKQPPEISDVLKPHYLEWLVVTKGMTDTRQQYFTLALQKPYCKQLHSTMFKIETTELVMDYGICDRIHDLACQQFAEDVEVWQNKMQYYLKYKQGKISNEVIQQTYMAAQKSLSAVSFLDFKTKYYAMIDKINIMI